MVLLFSKNNLIVPDVGNSHWEEINIIDNLDINNEPVFFGWPWYEAYFNANYQNTPVDEETKSRLIEEAEFPIFLYPHANEYCAIIGGTELKTLLNGKDISLLVISAQEQFGQ